MEKALEHQAQLIDRFEAMEKAQRQWEEKFRENNSSTTPVCISRTYHILSAFS
jgi:phage regulator Rha-like protein